MVEAEYKVPMEEIFLSFEEQPIGSASIAQAHMAVLRDGRPVVVKVQRPGIRETMAEDVALLHRAARLLNLDVYKRQTLPGQNAVKHCTVTIG